MGLMTGALTSTPGLAAAQGAAGELSAQAAIGYAIAYPFGVVGVVLFVQLMPKLLKADMKKEVEALEAAAGVNARAYEGRTFKLDAAGFFSFSVVIVLGYLLGSVEIPLSGGADPAVFALGTTGGPLLVGLLFGHLGHIGPIDLTLKKSALETFRELGLMLFLIGAGTEGGAALWRRCAGGRDALRLRRGHDAFADDRRLLCGREDAEIVVAQQPRLHHRRHDLHPGLGTLIAVAGTDDVASAYAATYPIALVSVVLASQFLTVLFA